jgi:prepilin-type N-terminal cleavage/methylation domain-containing protein
MNNDKGFTLVELIAVIMLLSIIIGIATVKMHKSVDLAYNASIIQTVKDLNAVESQSWYNAHLSLDSTFGDDSQLITTPYYQDVMKTFQWVEQTSTGGIIVCSGRPVSFKRVPSSKEAPATWSKE